MRIQQNIQVNHRENEKVEKFFEVLYLNLLNLIYSEQMSVDLFLFMFSKVQRAT